MAPKTVRVDAVRVDGFKIEATARQHKAFVDQPAAGGGTDTGPTPLEYLFISLAGCVATIGAIIANQRKLDLRNIEVSVEGDLDTDGFMGKNADLRVGFTSIRVHTKIDADMSQEEKEQFVRDIDARCPISDNLVRVSAVDFTVE
ncbi:MAG: OsmC family protein [Anaerolineaceae bacterium]|nr:OsmC family protein [Anaerolineaceae bacterium]